jgi:hypothetical protein
MSNDDDDVFTLMKGHNINNLSLHKGLHKDTYKNRNRVLKPQAQ